MIRLDEASLAIAELNNCTGNCWHCIEMDDEFDDITGRCEYICKLVPDYYRPYCVNPGTLRTESLEILEEYAPPVA